MRTTDRTLTVAPRGTQAPTQTNEDHPETGERIRRSRYTERLTLGITVLAVLATIWTVREARALLVPITVGILLSYVLDPVVVLFERRVPRWLAATIVFVMAILAMSVTVYALRNQGTALVSRLPTAAQQLRQTIQGRVRSRNGPVAQVQRAADELKQISTPSPRNTDERVRRVEVEAKSFDIADFMWSSTMTAAGFVADTIVVGFLSFYLLLVGDLFRRRFVELAGPTLTRKKITLQILNEISAQISGYLFLRFVISAIVAVGTGLAFWALGLAQPAVWGIAAGVMNVVPYVGPASVAIAAALAAFVQFQTLTMATVIGGAAVGVAAVEAYVITPWLTSRAAQMNPVAVFIGLAFWGWLWGLPGLLLAVPLLMIAKAICEHVETLHPVAALLKE